MDNGARVLNSLRGTYLNVPDLRPLYKNWKQGVSPHYLKLVAVIDRHLERIIPKKDLQKFKAVDFALLTCRYAIETVCPPKPS
jgi:hypothetical protein